MTPNIEVSQYVIDGIGWQPIRIERMRGYIDPPTWAVRYEDTCLSKTGNWDVEPQPSSRTKSWLASHRFDNMKDATNAAVTAWQIIKETT